MNADRRRYHRLQTCLPLDFRLPPHSGGGASAGRGTLKDISLGGLYFLCPPPAPARIGDLLDLTIAITPGDLENSRACRLQARSRVVRLDPPAHGNDHKVGIAVTFLGGLLLSSP